MACGTAVVANDIPVLREVGGSAASYVPVDDIVAWSSAVIARVAERTERGETWRNRRKAGFEQAAQFTWSEYARRMIEIYRDVLGR